MCLPTSELDQLIKSRFKHAIADPETRYQLLGDNRDMTLSQMIEKAQRFEDFTGAESSKAKKNIKDDRDKFCDIPAQVRTGRTEETNGQLTSQP